MLNKKLLESLKNNLIIRRFIKKMEQWVVVDNYSSIFHHSSLTVNWGSSDILLNLASPPKMVLSVSEMELTEISPSCLVNLFLFPGFSTTTLSSPEYSNVSAQAFSTSPFSHINLKPAPLSIFLSKLPFRVMKIVLLSVSGFSLVTKITQRLLSEVRQTSFALFPKNSGTEYNHIYMLSSSRAWLQMSPESFHLRARTVQSKCSKIWKHLYTRIYPLCKEWVFFLRFWAQ